MSRSVLLFRLSNATVQLDLISEFSRHVDVVATPSIGEGRPSLRVETNGSSKAAWDVRATVGMFDDNAIEVSPSEGSQA